MDKKQLLAAMGLGATLAIGGQQTASKLLGSADAASTFSHAVDLRRNYAGRDAGYVQISVWGTTEKDGQVKDLGRATICKPTPATVKQAASLMDAVANDCKW